MKSCLIVTICCVIATLVISSNALEIPQNMKKQAKKLHKRCQSQTEASDDVIRQALKGTLPNNKQFECYIHCLFDLIGVIGDNNAIQLENLTQVLPEEVHPLLIKLSETCGTKAGDDKCSIAFNTLQCYVEHNPVLLTDFEFLFE